MMSKSSLSHVVIVSLDQKFELTVMLIIELFSNETSEGVQIFSLKPEKKLKFNAAFF